jgi:hypothetical protein
MNEVGPTHDLSLRVSVATLVRVVFTNPENGNLMLALERKPASARKENGVNIKAQPFGGAVRIHDPNPLLDITGGFNYDSQSSLAQQDFRILIRPTAWQTVQAFCMQQFENQEDPVLESSPVREMVEEFEDSLGFTLRVDQVAIELLWTILENEPSPTWNYHAVEKPLTVRIYRVFQARIMDPNLSQAIWMNSQKNSDQEMLERVMENIRQGVRGRVNAFLALPMESLRQFYLSLTPDQRNSEALFGQINMAGNVPALLNDLPVPKFQYLDLR